MPTTRRKSGNPHSTTSSQQSTISFNNKTSRVTKPSITDPTSSKKAQSKLSESAEADLVERVSTPEPKAEEPETTEIAIRESPRKAATTPKPKPKSKRKTSEADDALAAAEKITDTQLKKYWKAEEDARLAPRVHQNSLPLPEKILRHFDLSSQYGPCIGIPRLKRWHRANTLALSPPIEVLAVLLREEKKKPSERQCGQLAYIDELAGGRAVLVD